VTLKKVFIGISAAAMLSGAAFAADASVKAGAAVSDTSGAAVGTIESVNGDLAVVSTGTNKVSLPVSAFGKGDKGPVIAMTKAQLDAAAGGAKADAKAELMTQLNTGSLVYGSDGAAVGTVESTDAQFATLKIGEQKVKLPLESFSKGAQGAVIGMTAAELKAAVGASTQQSAAATTGGSAQN
jgi:preprotein translocase subunit YajC